MENPLTPLSLDTDDVSDSGETDKGQTTVAVIEEELTVTLGSSVEFSDESGELLELVIGNDTLPAGGQPCISADSPIARALLGARPGDDVQVRAPRGQWTAHIIAIRSV